MPLKAQPDDYNDNKQEGNPAAEPAQPSTRKVFAHYMVGLTNGQSLGQWTAEIAAAKSAAIDGFALNIGPQDPWTQPQLDQAYRAAEEGGGFVLFLSFDMAAGAWTVDQVAALIQRFRRSPAQARVAGRPLVSTFEGPGWAANWATVRGRASQGGGDIFLVPDWTSLGPAGVARVAGLIDGAFSWDAWPQAGQFKMSTAPDRAYQQALGGKKFMMGVSPWFYARLPQWNKNWYSSSESLWFDRWQQVLEVMPDFVQIISWNDFSESGYIADVILSQVVPGADTYVAGHSHAALRALLPVFIAAYKAGARSVALPPGQDAFAVAWYRTTSVRCGWDGNTKWGQAGQSSAADGARDVVSVVAMARGAARVTVAIGKDPGQVFDVPGGSATYLEVPFEGRAGPVVLGMDGRTATGPAISNECPPCGHVLFNSVSIQV